jgi:hypothetical protein
MTILQFRLWHFCDMMIYGNKDRFQPKSRLRPIAWLPLEQEVESRKHDDRPLLQSAEAL